MLKKILLSSLICISPSLLGYTCKMSFTHDNTTMEQTFSDFNNNEVLHYEDDRLVIDIQPSITEYNTIALSCSIAMKNELGNTIHVANMQMEGNLYQTMQYKTSTSHTGNGNRKDIKLSISISE